jgi:hypothetical protein
MLMRAQIILFFKKASKTSERWVYSEVAREVNSEKRRDKTWMRNQVILSVNWDISTKATTRRGPPKLAPMWRAAPPMRKRGSQAKMKAGRIIGGISEKTPGQDGFLPRVISGSGKLRRFQSF